jgi:hypothetical protein
MKKTGLTHCGGPMKSQETNLQSLVTHALSGAPWGLPSAWIPPKQAIVHHMGSAINLKVNACAQLPVLFLPTAAPAGI